MQVLFHIGISAMFENIIKPVKLGFGKAGASGKMVSAEMVRSAERAG